MNESPKGRDGWIFAMGRKFYHVYKQDFPMEFWYGLTPDANREDSSGLQIDVRTLPEEYRRRPVEFNWSTIPKRSMGKTMRLQLLNHALAFAEALFHGYSLEDHAQRERDKAEAEWADYRAQQAAAKATSIAKSIASNGTCSCCGLLPAAIDGECMDCFAIIPF